MTYDLIKQSADDAKRPLRKLALAIFTFGIVSDEKIEE
jgi:hypothetical protein